VDIKSVNPTATSASLLTFERRKKERRKDEILANEDSGCKVYYTEDRRKRQGRRYNEIMQNQLPVCNYEINEKEKCFSHSSPIKPQRLMYDLSRLLPPNTIYLADIGNSFLWAIHYLFPRNNEIDSNDDRKRGSLRMSMKFASMGWAIGGAVGTALGCNGAPVVCITGDGSFLMCGQEITAAVKEKLTVIYVVLNDSALGTVKHGQRMSGAELVGYEIPRVNFCAFAQSMGVPSFKIHSSKDFEKLDVNAMLNYKGPTLLDVYIDPDEIPPLGERLKMLASSGK
jgi:acetolactate synthase-1/2/3 large subunit